MFNNKKEHSAVVQCRYRDKIESKRTKQHSLREICEDDLGASMQGVQGDNILWGETRNKLDLAGKEHICPESRPSTFGEMTKKPKRKCMSC